MKTDRSRADKRLVGERLVLHIRPPKVQRNKDAWTGHDAHQHFTTSFLRSRRCGARGGFPWRAPGRGDGPRGRLDRALVRSPGLHDAGGLESLRPGSLSAAGAGALGGVRLRNHDASIRRPGLQSASGAQQAAIRQAFQKFLGAFYANRIDGYSSEKFQVDPVVENRGGQRVVKTTLVRPGGGSTRIDYLVNGSRVIDIYLDGSISEVASRRGEFSSIIASGGPDALVKALRDK